MCAIGVGLYDWSGLSLDAQSLQILHQYETTLVHMVTVFQALVAQGASGTLQGRSMS